MLCITNNSIKHQSFDYTQLKDNNLYFKQFNSAKVNCLHLVSMSNCSIWPIDMTLSDAITLGQSGPRSDGNKGAHGVMVIVVGNGHGNTSSNPGRD